MEDTDKTIEVIKAAMEKEKMMKEKANETVDETVETSKPDDIVENNSEESAKVEESSVEENDISMDMTEAEDNLEELSEDADDNKASKGKGLFKNKLSKELEAKDKKIEELNDRLIRTMAEFDNFRKRTEKEKSAMFDIGAKSVIEKLLPIVDNFERGLGALTEKEKESAFAQGIELIYKQLITALDEIGVKPIEAVGKEFNPDFHNAVMHGEDDTLGEKIITDEFQKGYMYRDSVVRYSMVKVVN